MSKIIIDPVSRIEGHLKFETKIENEVVVDAKCSADMFRGIEKALIGYDARAAQQITQRVCGACPYAQAEAAALALENAMQIKPNQNGQLLRNLIVGSYRLHDYLMHFYIFSALDFIDITALLNYKGQDKALTSLKNWVNYEIKSNKIFPATPFLPRYEASYASNQDLNISTIKHYLDAISIMSKIQKMVSIFGGKSPHPVAIEAGGVTTIPTIENLVKYESYLQDIKTFIKDAYFQDLKGVASYFKEYFKIGRGTANYLSYDFLPDQNGKNYLFSGGATINAQYKPLEIEKIREYTTYSYYNNSSKKGYVPLDATTISPISYETYQKEHTKEDGKYSWSKAPRYDDVVVEVGPIAEVINTYRSGKNKELNALIDTTNKELGITIDDYSSVMGRHLCRGLIAILVVNKLESDLSKVLPGKIAYEDHPIPKNVRGVGLTEASRGALAHWIDIDEKGLIKNYEMIIPTTWNISPKDPNNQKGAVEEMLIGTRIKDTNHPIELARIVRSTDPCMACSVH